MMEEGFIVPDDFFNDDLRLIQFCISESIIVAASEGYLLPSFFLASTTNKESHLLSPTASQEKKYLREQHHLHEQYVSTLPTH